jgi:hypothetical protein
VSNIYVIQDKGNPANEGKVFLYRYGVKIFEKLTKVMNEDPEFPDDPTFDPFHVIEGANFRLRQKKQAGYPNYDDSTFEQPSPMFKGDEKAIMVVLAGLRGLTDLVAPEKFKSYADLKKRLDKTMGFDTATYLTTNDVQNDVPDAPAPKARRSRPAPEDDDEVPTPTSARPWTPPVATADDDEDVDGRLAAFDDE